MVCNGPMLHDISRKHKICHSERSEESAEAWTWPPPTARSGQARPGDRGRGPAARQRQPDPRGSGFFAALRM